MTPMRVSKHLDLYGVKRDQRERNRKMTGICFFRQRLKRCHTRDHISITRRNGVRNLDIYTAGCNSLSSHTAYYSVFFQERYSGPSVIRISYNPELNNPDPREIQIILRYK